MSRNAFEVLIAQTRLSSADGRPGGSAQRRNGGGTRHKRSPSDDSDISEAKKRTRVDDDHDHDHDQQTVQCPIDGCNKRVLVSFVNLHLDFEHFNTDKQPESDNLAGKVVQADPASAATAAAEWELEALDDAPLDADDTPDLHASGLESTRSSRASHQAGSGSGFKIQKSIHLFFGGEDTTIPGFFHFAYPSPAVFLRKPPPKASILWREEIVWRGRHLSLALTCNLASATAPIPASSLSAPSVASSQPDDPAALSAPPATQQSPLFQHPSDNLQFSVSLLKSHLQKCVRRCRSQLAAQTAFQLAHLDMDSLLRRLPIIMVEDSLLHPHVTSLVWLMAASSKGFRLPDQLVELVVGIARAIAECPVREDCAQPPAPVSFEHIARLPHEQLRSVLYALQMRRSFGGMKGDMSLLDFQTVSWHRRFKEFCDVAARSEAPPELQEITFAELRAENASQSLRAVHAMSYPIAITPLKDMVPLLLSDWELAAVDYHVSNVKDVILRRLQSLSQPTTPTPSSNCHRVSRLLERIQSVPGWIETLIWEKSSSLSMKEKAVFSMDVAGPSGLPAQNENGEPSAGGGAVDTSSMDDDWAVLGPIFLESAKSVLLRRKP